MQKSENSNEARANYRRVQASTTLNRKYVKRPSARTDVVVSVKRSPKISRFGTNDIQRKVVEKDTQIAPAETHPIQAVANKKMQERSNKTQDKETRRPSAKELKDMAIQKALNEANKSIVTEQAQDSSDKDKKGKMHFGFGRVVLATACAAVAIFAIIYFVNLNMPDISLRVAAMQTGIEASYPSYVPRDYNLSSITSEDGKVELIFKKGSDGEYSLTEEKTSWDSSALLNNYVKEAFNDDYTVVKEQGLTIYSNERNAAWVNGGIFYRIKVISGELTKKQIRSIAVSL